MCAAINRAKPQSIIALIEDLDLCQLGARNTSVTERLLGDAGRSGSTPPVLLNLLNGLLLKS
jgi:hypothetical protein